VTLTAWRIIKRKHARQAFSGEGAAEFGGRWNNPGTLMVYTSQSQALAVLEMLVHLDSPDLLAQYVLLEVDFDESFVTTVEASDLPANWRADPAPPEVRAIGDDWILTGTSVVLRVPSALLPDEANFLLNPRHPDFTKLRIGKPQPFHLDPRLANKP
jgi:RES domain-containing protein